MRNPILLLLLAAALGTGCRSAKRPPAPPLERARTEQTAEQAAQLTEKKNWSAAARQWQEAADRFALLNDRTNAAIALHNRGMALRQMGELQAAKTNLEAAAVINHAIGSRKEWWGNQLALLQVEAEANQTNALELRFQSLAPLAEELKDSNLRANYLNELGLWQLQQGSLEAAAESFRQARDLFERSGHRFGTFTVIANEARLFEAQGNYAAAMDAWHFALAGFEDFAEPAAIAGALAGLGRTLLAARQDLPTAEDYLRRAAHNYGLLQRPRLQATMLRLLLKALELQNKSAAAQGVREELARLP